MRLKLSETPVEFSIKELLNEVASNIVADFVLSIGVLHQLRDANPRAGDIEVVEEASGARANDHSQPRQCG